MIDSPAKRYVVIIKFGGSRHNLTRAQEAVPTLEKILTKIGREKPQLVFRSDDGGTFGYFIQTALSAPAIRGTIDSPTEHKFPGVFGSPLTNDDSIVVIELGEDFTGRGFSRAWTWLQHRT